MKRGTFKTPTIEEVKEKQALKREKLLKQPRKRLNRVKRATVANLPSQTPSARKPRKKKSSLSKLKKELDRVFSIYIRKRDDGQCFTCPKKDDYKKMQNGHFVPRQYLAVRWDEKNCNCQCYACNMLYGGQGATYAIRLTQKYGAETVAFLESQRWVTVKLDESWYEAKIAEYKTLLN
jgi:5-methylcytosine-specific restriction endonuclease McrA